MELMDIKQELSQRVPIQRLRCLLENAQIIELTSSELQQSLRFSVLDSCEQLLAFQQYMLFEAVMKKYDIKQIGLLENEGTRKLYQNYRQKNQNKKIGKLRADDNGKQAFNKSQKQRRSEARDRDRQIRLRLLKFCLIVFSLLLASGIAIKYRAKIITFFKLLLNLK